MNGRLRSRLLYEYPIIFKEIWGPEEITCEDGWFKILNDLCLIIKIYLEDYPDIPKVNIKKIEQKFGILFIYYTGGDKLVKTFVQTAERLSYRTCELCGDIGELYSQDGTEFTPTQTLCYKHGLKNLYRKIIE